MAKLTPQRRKAVLLATSSALFACTPLLLNASLHGISRAFAFGIGIGASFPLLLASIILIRRNRLVCRD